MATVMVITTCMVVLVMIVDWEISSLLVVPFAVLYLIIECGFLSSNLTKVCKLRHGGSGKGREEGGE